MAEIITFGLIERFPRFEERVHAFLLEYVIRPDHESSTLLVTVIIVPLGYESCCGMGLFQAKSVLGQLSFTGGTLSSTFTLHVPGIS